MKKPMLPPGVSISADRSSMCLPMHFSGMNYFSIQLTLSMTIAVIVNVLLNPFGLPTFVCHMIAGFVMGPSVLGQIPNYREMLFPLSTSTLLDSYANLAMVFQLFLIGVQVNPSLIGKGRKKAVCIGTLVVVIPLVLSSSFAVAVASILKQNATDSQRLLTTALLQSVSSFPVIVFYVNEVNILSLEFSHVAYSCSMVCGVLCACVTGIVEICHAGKYPEDIAASILAHAVIAYLVLYVARSIIDWIMRQVPEGQTVKEMHLGPVYLLLMVLTILCAIGNVNWLFGPFLLGVIIPSRSPLGMALVKRFEVFHTWTLMPIFYLSHGMMTDLSQLDTKFVLIMELIILVTYAGKFLGAFIPALCYNMSFREAILLGLTMNAQGFIEISSYRNLQDAWILDLGSFQVMSVSMLFSTAILTPLLGYLYKNSLRSKPVRRGTRNTELQVLACAYNQENVPSIIHLLKAMNPTINTPINLCLIHFVERIGHATPLIIDHKVHTETSSDIASSQRIINVFKSYEDHNSRGISTHPYTVVSHHAPFPNDVCRLAEQQRSSIIILPFHKELATGILNPDLRTVNIKILDKATCSVGILIDRGLLGGINFIHENWSSYHIAMIFIGGADDREALAQAVRMSTHPTIELTVIRFITDYPNPTYTTQTEMSLDEEMIRGFKKKYASRNGITFVEEEATDGIGVAKVLESLEDRYELIILGRQHDQKSPLIQGLTEWNECSELGTIGDIVTTSNYGGKSTIFIVQREKTLSSRPSSFVINDEDSIRQSYDEENPIRNESDSS